MDKRHVLIFLIFILFIAAIRNGGPGGGPRGNNTCDDFKSDLVIQNITIFRLDESLTITPFVKNIGNVISGPSTLDLQSSLSPSSNWFLATPPILPNQIVAVGPVNLNVFAGTRYSVTAIADYYNEVREINENNNAATVVRQS